MTVHFHSLEPFSFTPLDRPFWPIYPSAIDLIRFIELKRNHSIGPIVHQTARTRILKFLKILREKMTLTFFILILNNLSFVAAAMSGQINYHGSVSIHIKFM